MVLYGAINQTCFRNKLPCFHREFSCSKSCQVHREYATFHTYTQDHFVYVPSQWETTLHCNIVSHWLGAYTKWSLAQDINYVQTQQYKLIYVNTHPKIHALFMITTTTNSLSCNEFFRNLGTNFSKICSKTQKFSYKKWFYTVRKMAAILSWLRWIDGAPIKKVYLIP